MLDLHNTKIKEMLYYLIYNATFQDLQNMVGIIQDDDDEEESSYT